MDKEWGEMEQNILLYHALRFRNIQQEILAEPQVQVEYDSIRFLKPVLITKNYDHRC